MSSRLMIALMLFYGAIALAAGVERNWPRLLYFFGAIAISVAILWMGYDSRSQP